MLNRVALDREQRCGDIVVDFVPDLDINWPDSIEVSARAASIRVRLSLPMTSSRCSQSPWTAPSPEEKTSCISVRRPARTEAPRRLMRARGLEPPRAFRLSGT
jgi:hypothetical protein